MSPEREKERKILSRHRATFALWALLTTAGLFGCTPESKAVESLTSDANNRIVLTETPVPLEFTPTHSPMPTATLAPSVTPTPTRTLTPTPLPSETPTFSPTPTLAPIRSKWPEIQILYQHHVTSQKFVDTVIDWASAGYTPIGMEDYLAYLGTRYELDPSCKYVVYTNDDAVSPVLRNVREAMVQLPQEMEKVGLRFRSECRPNLRVAIFTPTDFDGHHDLPTERLLELFPDAQAWRDGRHEYETVATIKKAIGLKKPDGRYYFDFYSHLTQHVDMVGRSKAEVSEFQIGLSVRRIEGLYKLAGRAHPPTIVIANPYGNLTKGLVEAVQLAQIDGRRVGVWFTINHESIYIHKPGDPTLVGNDGRLKIISRTHKPPWK